MPKGDVSIAITARIPAAMTVDCRRCSATHILETLFRAAVLPAGVAFDPDERLVTFVPLPDWPGVPEETVGAAQVVITYLRLVAPADCAPAAALGLVAAGARPGGDRALTRASQGVVHPGKPGPCCSTARWPVCGVPASRAGGLMSPFSRSAP